MPLTPFHFGPAAMVKWALGRRFSLFIFGVSQVIIDIETAVNVFRGAYPVHATLHGFLGSNLVILALAAFGRPLYAAAATRVQASELPILLKAEMARPLTTSTLLISAAFGAWSHVVLDGIMHSDLLPFAPFSARNPMLHACPLLVLHAACVAAGIVGAAGWALFRAGPTRSAGR